MKFWCEWLYPWYFAPKIPSNNRQRNLNDYFHQQCIVYDEFEGNWGQVHKSLDETSILQKGPDE